jgi:hypothetical protein
MEAEWVTNVLNQAILIGTDDFKQQVKERSPTRKA